MKLRELLDKWSLTKLKISAGFLDAEFQANDQDRDAAWSMYVELLTRITTQALPAEHGDEAAALASVHSLFAITREILKEPGRRHADKFAKIAIVVLNQKVRPFTAYWHKPSLAGAFDDSKQRERFRAELAELQVVLTHYAGLLSDLADVEDLTKLEQD
ncbi:hypothetical protein QTH90_21075 [Variovorax sp. J2P1-59]|uniref:hypothetical protein n=1 Tax=Variovorax flavidus TaxID=3053501 RepID=UPI002576BCE3|nr:hypothetical protein [Variovorax sp. J2P1-59]MDM0076915.1 hypothetical protein [Variovorax sp. J2P1-59]